MVKVFVELASVRTQLKPRKDFLGYSTIRELRLIMIFGEVVKVTMR